MDKIDIKGINTETTKDLNRYVRKKISKLDAFIPRQARKGIRSEVLLSESKNQNKKQFTAEVNIYLPKEIISAKETTVNMYAAIDIVEEKLKAQLRKYKSMFSAKRGRREAQVRTFLGKIIRKKSLR